jgi:hypothetical protein
MEATKERNAVQCASLAAEYLDFCEKYRPPTPYYVRKHLRWVFRGVLQGRYHHLFHSLFHRTVVHLFVC